ncbi:MAG: hypothetical protein C4518_17125 [Desulfobacteraceae bacterium]|nr:MAG: hypothetical protein C4518_17125 [Desulfobacteraceae bacterium]
MQTPNTEKSPVELAAQDLFDFAVDREDIKAVLAALHPNAQTPRHTLEYELAILKIISVGWSLAYFLEHSPHKAALAENFWDGVREFSQTVSTTSGLMTGQNIDYFQILKDRLNTYVGAMNEKTDATEPAAVIGPEFARTCGNADDVFTVMTGARLFIATIGSVKSYLEEVKLR